MRVTKPLDLPALKAECQAAGIALPRGLGTTGLAPDGSTDLMTYDAAGALVDLPAAAAPVVAAHDAATTPAAVQAAADATSLSDLTAQYQGLLDGLTNIRTRMASINAGPASPTAAQTGTALKTIASDITTLCNGSERILQALRVIVRRTGGG